MNENQLSQMRQSAVAKIDKLIDAEHKFYKQNKEVASGVLVSDHAILRFLERVHNIDIEALRRKVLSEKDIELAKFGATAIKKNGFQYVFKNQCLVTIL